MALKKGSAYTNLFQIMVKRMDESGLLRRLNTKYFSHFQDCDPSRVSSVGLEKLISAFIFLVGATILSVVCIIFEKCHKRIDSNKYDNQSADSNEEKIEEISSNQQEAQCNIEMQNNQNDVKLWKYIIPTL